MMHGFCLAAAGSVLVAMVTLSARAAAEEPRVDNRARAQQLFDSALTDAEAGNFAAACPKFQASQDADPKPSTLLNLASCYEKNGQTASAWGAFREAEGLARKSGRADWEQAAHTHAEALEPKLLRLTVQVPEASRAAGLVVTRDGNRLGAGEWGVAIPVDPGEHAITASADGKKPWDTLTSVKEKSASVTVPALEDLPTEAPVFMPPTMQTPAGSVDRPAPSWWTPSRKLGVGAVGFGGMGLLVGTVLGLAANSRYSDAKARCADGTHGCPDDALTDSDSAHDLAAAATVIFVVGAAAAATGAALIVFGGPKDSVAPNVSVIAGPGSASIVGTW